jgi:hypothetical protein
MIHGHVAKQIALIAKFFFTERTILIFRVDAVFLAQ